MRLIAELCFQAMIGDWLLEHLEIVGRERRGNARLVDRTPWGACIEASVDKARSDRGINPITLDSNELRPFGNIPPELFTRLGHWDKTHHYRDNDRQLRITPECGSEGIPSPQGYSKPGSVKT